MKFIAAAAIRGKSDDVKKVTGGNEAWVRTLRVPSAVITRRQFCSAVTVYAIRGENRGASSRERWRRLRIMIWEGSRDRLRFCGGDVLRRVVPANEREQRGRTRLPVQRFFHADEPQLVAGPVRLWPRRYCQQERPYPSR